MKKVKYKLLKLFIIRLVLTLNCSLNDLTSISETDVFLSTTMKFGCLFLFSSPIPPSRNPEIVSSMTPQQKS